MSTNNLNILLKWIGTFLAFGVWGAFAYLGKTPVEGFITALTGVVTGLSVHSISRATSPSSTQGAPNANS